MKYTDSGLWIDQEGKNYRLGLSDKGRDELGNINFVEVNADETQVKKGDALVDIEAAKAVMTVEAPFDMTIIETNERLEDHPEDLDSADRSDNWILLATDIGQDDYQALNDSSD